MSSLDSPPLTFGSPPPPPPPPTPSTTCTAASAGSGASQNSDGHQFVREAEELNQEVSYLVQPLCKRAAAEGKRVLTLVRDVKPVVQHGPMCGLVALSVASQLLDGGVVLPDRLLACAKEKGFSKQGEMFSAQNLFELAQSELNCTGAILRTDSVGAFGILTALSEGRAMVVPYDADKDHSPCLARGHKTHWCTLLGFAILTDSVLPECEDGCSTHVHLTLTGAHQLLQGDRQEFRARDSGDVYVFARQGKSRHLGLWNCASLMASNANLMEVGPHRDSSDYVIPYDGISNSLCSLIISLQKN